MRIAYPSGHYRPESSTGGNAHVGQFISNAVAQGHDVWTWPGDKHPAATRIPSTRLGRLKTLRRMDAIYIRVEWSPPEECRWGVSPIKQILGSPVMVWEFNTIPEQGLDLGKSEANVRTAIKKFREYGRGCDLAICVSSAMADYVQRTLNIERTLTVPNGSDPDLFSPNVQPMERMQSNPKHLNAVWVGSANLDWHNLELICRAARLLWERGEGDLVAFHFIGPGIGSMGDMPPNVNYHGPERYEEIPRWLSAMDVGLSLYHPGPSDYSSPLKLFDYMASGLTVISTFQPQTQEVFERLGQTDLLIPNDDASALADALLKLVADRERIRKLGQAGRQLVIDFYNWRRAVADTIGEIEIVLSERS